MSLSIEAFNNTPVANFQNYWIDDGLPSRTIWSIHQDLNGFLWFSSSNGFVRFDGYEFKYVIPSNDPELLRNAIIRDITSDANGDLWLATENIGLVHYQTEKNVANVFRTKGANSLKITQALRTVATDSKGNIWFGGVNFIGYLEISTSELKSPVFESRDDRLLSSTVKSIYFYNGVILLGTNKGLFKYDPNSFVISPITNSIEPNLSILTIKGTQNEGLLVGTTTGLFKLNIVNKKELSLSNYALELKSEKIIGITEDHSGHIWLASFGNGIFEFLDGKVIRHIKHDKSSTKSLSENNIISIFIDSSNTLWAGTFDSGINRLDLLSLQFKTYNESTSSLNCLESPVIYSIIKTRDNEIWLGTDKGLVRFDEHNLTCESFFIDISQKKSFKNTILSLKHNGFGSLMVGTLSGAFNFSLSENAFHPITDLPEIPIYDFQIENNDKLYIATDQGLFSKSLKSPKFTKLDAEKNLQLSISKIELGPDGLFWLATDKGLFYLENEIINEFSPANGKKNLGVVDSLFFDKNNRRWVGTLESGLVIFNSDKTVSKKILSNEVFGFVGKIRAIVGGGNDDVWISSSNGLYKLNTDLTSVEHYTQYDGLQSIDFVRGSYFREKAKNKIYLGGRKGLTFFEHDKIQQNKIVPEIKFTDIFVLDHSDAENSILNKLLINNSLLTDKTEFRYDVNSIGFEFSALSFSNPRMNRYAYRLLNLRKSWKHVDSKQRKVIFRNLEPGDYAFEVKGTNNHGIWNEEPARFSFSIKPPFWQTRWAFASYFILSILIIALLVKSRTLSLERRAINLRSQVDKRTQDLALEKSKVESLLELKNKEFATISHEFRTPLTLVLGPVKQLIFSESDPKKRSKMQTIRRNGMRLLRMVDQLLYMERYRAEKQGEKTLIHLQSIVHHLAISFEDLCKEKNIGFTLLENENIWLKTTPSAIETILLNLLSNAVKYTPANGQIKLSAKLIENHHCKITVEDSGVGIPSDLKEKIFSRYFRVSNAYSEVITGAGIGLSLVKELVVEHAGKIEIESAIEKGTCFHVFLPITGERAKVKEHFSVKSEALEFELQNLSNLPQVASTEGSLQKVEVTSNEQESAEDSRPTILIIEDNLDMRVYIAGIVSAKYRCLMAENGQKGEELAVRVIPDLIVSDVMMPEKDGYLLSENLKQDVRTSHIPIILLTARGDRKSRLTGWKTKVDEYLTKPFDEEELIIRISNLLAIRALLRKRFSQQILRDELVSLGAVKHEFSTIDAKFLEKFETCIKESYQDNNFGLNQMAQIMALGERQLQRKIKSLIDISPAEYLRNYRLTQARKLLSEGNSIKAVSFDCGFSSVSYFSSCFKARFGITPKNATLTSIQKNNLPDF